MNRQQATTNDHHTLNAQPATFRGLLEIAAGGPPADPDGTASPDWSGVGLPEPLFEAGLA